LKRISTVIVSLALCLLLAGVVLPVLADWSRVELGGVSVCKDKTTGVTFKPPYSAKADVTKACNVLTSFVPWLGTASAAPVLSHTQINPDGTHDTAFPADGKVNATVAWSAAALATAMAVVVAQNTGTATDINLATYCTGTGCASATYTIVTAVTGWSIGGSGSSHLLNAGSTAGSSVASGALTLKVTNGSSTDTSAAFPWSYVVPPVPAVRWGPGRYGDCSAEVSHADHRIAIGNLPYTETKACIDYWATQTNVHGVFILADWTSFEGSTLGTYTSSASNGMGAAGTIGYALWDDLGTYVASKGLKMMVGIEWAALNLQNCGNGYAGASPDTYFPAYLIQTTCSPGTDASATYGVTLETTAGFVFARLWKAAVMNRLIALAQAYGTRYDSNATWEEVIFLEQDPSFTGAVGTDGFDWTSLATQIARLPTAVRPYWQHTNLGIETNWLTPSGQATVIAAMSNASAYFTVEANNSIPWQTTYGENTYLGLGVVGGQNFGTHDYRTEIPFTVWTAGPELCDLWDSKPGADAASNYTPTQFYDYYMTLGKTDETSPRALKPSHWIMGRTQAALYCPTVANQQWGTTSSGGFNQQATGHPLNTTAPSLYAGGTTAN
jgi:hypothetical protein